MSRTEIVAYPVRTVYGILAKTESSLHFILHPSAAAAAAAATSYSSKH